MASITYADKASATNPAAPASNEIFTAANANEIKTVVNGKADQVLVSLVTIPFTNSTINAAYPSVLIGQEVACPNLTDGPLIYKKITSTVWYSLPMGTI